MRDLVLPVAIFAGLFLGAAVLVIAGHYDGFSEATKFASASPASDRYGDLHEIVTGEHASHTAARILSSGPGATAAVARLTYRILFDISESQTAIQVLLSQGSFDRVGRRIQGWKSAADLVFGSEEGRLGDMELALYAYWIVHGQDAWGPDDLIATRRLVLDRLRARGVIDEKGYREMNSAALVLRPTPIPIN